MGRKVKLAIRALILWLLRPFSSQIVDYKTGKPLGKAFLFPWRGKILVIGAEGDLIPCFLPQPRLTFWKQELGFTTHPPIDFPSLADENPDFHSDVRGSSQNASADRDLGAGGSA
jgi:hypothetical protein